jgi:acyl-CoA thioester hydrolase
MQAMNIAQLAAYPLVIRQQIAWGDMDAFGHVNNVQYYRYIENARIAYFRHLNLEQTEIHTVIASSSCRYLSAVVYPDTLAIGVRVEELRSSAFRMSYALYSEQQQNIVAQAETVVVCVNAKTQQKSLMSDQIKQAFIAFEASVNHQPSLKR